MQKIKGIKTIVSCALAVGLCGSKFCTNGIGRNNFTGQRNLH